MYEHGVAYYCMLQWCFYPHFYPQSISCQWFYMCQLSISEQEVQIWRLYLWIPMRTKTLSLSLTDRYFCSKHGRVDTGVRGVWDLARLVLQHWGSSELWGAAATGTELHSVHWGLPASARFVKRYFYINGETRAKPLPALPNLPVTFLCLLIAVKWVGVGKSRESMIRLFW